MEEHRHEFEAYYHPDVSQKARELGVRAVELRKCRTCGRELTLVRTDGDWFPLFIYRDADEQDILLA